MYNILIFPSKQRNVGNDLHNDQIPQGITAYHRYLMFKQVLVLFTQDYSLPIN